MNRGSTSTKRQKILKSTEYCIVIALKNSITELTSIEGFNSRLDQVEKRISELKERAVEFIQSEEQKGKRIKKNEDSLRDLWDTIRRPIYTL